MVMCLPGGIADSRSAKIWAIPIPAQRVLLRENVNNDNEIEMFCLIVTMPTIA